MVEGLKDYIFRKRDEKVSRFSKIESQKADFLCELFGKYDSKLEKYLEQDENANTENEQEIAYNGLISIFNCLTEFKTGFHFTANPAQYKNKSLSLKLGLIELDENWDPAGGRAKISLSEEGRNVLKDWRSRCK